MALVIADRVKQATSTTGTGTVTLGSTFFGYQSFAVIGNGNTTYYAIIDSNTGDWEVGVGTYTASGTTLSRDVVLSSSNSGSLVSFAAGSKDVICTLPSERAVTEDLTQTLTNKTISADSNTLSGIAASSFVLSNASGNIDGSAVQKAIPSGVVVGTTDTQTLTNKTLAGVILNDGYAEEIFALTGTTPAISPTNGSIQTWTLSGSSTPTAGTWDDGQALTLMIDDGAANTITWTSMSVTWKTNGGVAPTLLTTGITPITFWKVGGILYGARVGNA